MKTIEKIGKAFLNTLISGVIIAIWAHYYLKNSYALLGLMLYSPVIFIFLWGAFTLYFLFWEKIKPLVIFHSLCFLLVISAPLYRGIKEAIGMDSLPRDLASYYYFGNNYSFLFENYKEMDKDTITLNHTELIKYDMESGGDIYFNSKNELIFKDNNGSFYTKLDPNGNEKQKIEYTDGTGVWSNLTKYSYILDNKIIDPNAYTYSDWLETDDNTQKPIVKINEKATLPEAKEKEMLENIIAQKNFLWSYEYGKTEQGDEFATERTSVFYIENEKVYVFYTKLDLYQYDAGDNRYNAKQEAETTKWLNHFFGEKGEKKDIFAQKNLPFNGFFLACQYTKDNYWNGVLCYQIPLERERFWVATDYMYAENKKVNRTHFHYRNAVEEMELFDDISLYKNKNLKYQLLKIGSYFFIVKPKK